MTVTVLTNNPLVKAALSGTVNIIFLQDYSHMDVLTEARNLVHSGYALVCDPLANRLEPETNPYISLVLEKKLHTCPRSIKLIEAAIMALSKRPVRIKYDEKINRDFQAMDKRLVDLIL